MAVFSSALLSASSRTRSELELLRRDMNDDDLSEPSGLAETVEQNVTLRRGSSVGKTPGGVNELNEDCLGMFFEPSFRLRSGLWRGLVFGLDFWRRVVLGLGLDRGLFFFCCSDSVDLVYGLGG